MREGRKGMVDKVEVEFNVFEGNQDKKGAGMVIVANPSRLDHGAVELRS